MEYWKYRQRLRRKKSFLPPNKNNQNIYIIKSISQSNDISSSKIKPRLLGELRNHHVRER